MFGGGVVAGGGGGWKGKTVHFIGLAPHGCLYGRNETAFLKPPGRLLNEVPPRPHFRGNGRGDDGEGGGVAVGRKTFRRQNDATCANTTADIILYYYIRPTFCEQYNARARVCRKSEYGKFRTRKAKKRTKLNLRRRLLYLVFLEAFPDLKHILNIFRAYYNIVRNV